MSTLTFFRAGDQVLLWSINVVLQVTIVSAVALAAAGLVRRSPATRYWLLCSALVLALLSPVIALVMQSSGQSLFTVTFAQPVKNSSNVSKTNGSLTEPQVAAPRTLNVQQNNLAAPQR